MFNYELDDLIEVDKINIFLNPNEKNAIVILGNKKYKYALPIWIGLWEADMLEIALLQGIPPRPLPYDLFLNLCELTNTKVNRVIIYGMENSTYLALIELERDGEIIYLDSRPSDALNIAVRAEAPIYVSRKLFEKEGISFEEALELSNYLGNFEEIEESEFELEELKDFEDFRSSKKKPH